MRSSLPLLKVKYRLIENDAGDTFRIAPLRSFTHELASMSPPARRNSFTTLSFRNSAAFQSEMLSLLLNTSSTLSLAIPHLTIAMSLQPLPQILTSRSAASNGGTGNVLGFSPEDGTVVNALCTCSWDSEEHDELMDSAMQSMFKQAEEKAKEMGVYARQLYLNYAAQWQDPIAGYGEEERQFLRKVSRRWDPEGVFQRAVPGGFKVWSEDVEEGSEERSRVGHDEL